VLVSNSGIGIFQEVRAKRTLDRLATLVAPTATLVRDGVEEAVSPDALVDGDLVRVKADDQVVADDRVVQSELLMLDESILTGESEPVARVPGQEVRSGRVRRRGRGGVRGFRGRRRQLRGQDHGRGANLPPPTLPARARAEPIVAALVAVMIPLGATIGYALWERHTPLDQAVPTSVAAVVTIVPEGLILLASLTYAVAALRIARPGGLAQQLNAIESLASVDVVCLDKTGTLTEPTLRVVDAVPAPGIARGALVDALGRYAASASSRNVTLEALAAAFPAERETAARERPFLIRAALERTAS
jgi:cation-transporting P-type ATPase E